MSKRREFIKRASGVLGGVGLAYTLPNCALGIVRRESVRPQLTQGLQFGDVNAHQGIVWSRSDRPARMWLDYSYTPSFQQFETLRGPYALANSDYTARIDLQSLRPDQQVYVRVRFQDLSNERVMSAPVQGSFITAPQNNSRSLHFLWSGDTAGQGYGINPDIGGMRIYRSMLNESPDFFIHSGDTIYADGPISATQTVENGQVWRNIVTEEVSKVAETLNEFRGRYKYNLLDENVLAFNRSVPQIWQWDDHEVVNNWSSAKDLTLDTRFNEKNIPALVARASTAFMEYSPMRPFSAVEQSRVYRKISHGPLLDLFVIDMRSYRGPNSANNQSKAGPTTAFLGQDQLRWLQQSLLESTAIWKVIAADMPIGLLVPDGDDKFENLANGDGEPVGRELEMAQLLRFIKRNSIHNLVWLTADVHYCAAHKYSPENAVFKDFNPFWEFVAGPLNAGAFGPNKLDNTFGPEVVFHKCPPGPNYSPLSGFQFYGDIKIDQESQQLTASLKDIDGKEVFSQRLNAVPALD